MDSKDLTLDIVFWQCWGVGEIRGSVHYLSDGVNDVI